MKGWYTRRLDFHTNNIFAINPPNGDSSSGVCAIHIMATLCAFQSIGERLVNYRVAKDWGMMWCMDGYLYQGYSLYINNFYTSPALVLDLFDHNTHTTGTFDGKRKGVPPMVKELHKKLSSKSVSRGSGAYIRDGSLVYVVWRCTKCISLVRQTSWAFRLHSCLQCQRS